MAIAIGQARVAVLQNHGLITLGRSIEQATIDMIDMERTCELCLSVLPQWDKVIEIPHDAAVSARETFKSEPRLFLQWSALVRQLETGRSHYAGTYRNASAAS